MTATKAYQIDLNKISEGFCFDVIYCHARNRNEARSQLLKKVRYDGLELKHSSKDISYSTIPVIRYKDADLIEFEGEYLCSLDIDKIKDKRKRIEYLDGILKDENVSHCYIRKHGDYYRPNACGYTSFKCFAGIYTKKDASDQGKSCHELQIIPINNAEHNAMMEGYITELQTRIIT